MDAMQLDNIDSSPEPIAVRRAKVVFEYLRPNAVFPSFTARSPSEHELPAGSGRRIQLHEIGEGLSSHVFWWNATAVKKEKPGNEFLDKNLKREYTLHVMVSGAFTVHDWRIHSNVRIPQIKGYFPKEENDWIETSTAFPETRRTKSAMTLMQQIFPVPRALRSCLVALFYPWTADFPLGRENVETVLNASHNRNCLVHIYLGRDKAGFSPSGFTLRDFPLCLDTMEHYNMNTDDLAVSMGKAYAIMHWGAAVNGANVDFVLGTSRKETELNEDLNRLESTFGLYLLDFDQCEEVDLAQENHVVYQAFRKALVTRHNKNYIPHYKKSPELFAKFKDRYIEAGEKVLFERGLSRFDMNKFFEEYEACAKQHLCEEDRLEEGMDWIINIDVDGLLSG